MPIELVHALALVKKAAAQVNLELGKFKDPAIVRAIIAAADEVIGGAARRRVPAGRLANGQRDPDEHERQ